LRADPNAGSSNHGRGGEADRIAPPKPPGGGPQDEADGAGLPSHSSPRKVASRRGATEGVPNGTRPNVEGRNPCDWLCVPLDRMLAHD